MFVAVDLPGEVREALARWGETSLSDPALRRLGAESLHITLAFLGYLPVKEVERLAAIVESVPPRAVRVQLRDPVPRPPRGRPRLFALPVESSAVVEVQAELQEALVAAGLYRPEKRPFWPHVTVARVRRAERGSKRPALVSELPGGLPQALLQPAVCRRLTLYRSELQPQGAQFTPLAQLELPGSGQQ